MTPDDFFKLAKKHEAEMLDLKFVDMLGSWQHCSFPIDALDEGSGPAKRAAAREARSRCRHDPAAADRSWQRHLRLPGGVLDLQAEELEPAQVGPQLLQALGAGRVGRQVTPT